VRQACGGPGRFCAPAGLVGIYPVGYTASMDTTFPTRLRQLREAAKLTQQELADRAGLHRVAIARYEAGDRAPTYAALCALADALGVPTDAFRHSERIPKNRQKLP
jgi:DNA-binding XRE family transcriptional regulator